MSLSQRNFEEKPYNVCIDCAHIGRNCDGPNFLAMSTERWCEWCHLRKEYLDWTNAEIAETANVSDISVARIMSGNVKDIRVTTMQAVTRALVNGSWGQYPCAMAAVGEKEIVDNPVIIEQCKHLQESLDAIKIEHKAELEEMRAFERSRIDYLKEQLKFTEDQLHEKDKTLAERYALIKQRNRVVLALSILLGVAVVVIIAALVIDGLNPDVGFFWLEKLLYNIGGVADSNMGNLSF